MADVRPFRGLRFTASAAPDLGLVLCPPYDVIDADDDRRLRERDPHNVVRLELTTASVAGGSEERYEDAAQTLHAWRADGVLARDEVPAYYLHEATFNVAGRTTTRREIIAAVGLEPWDRRVVLPHERTYPRAKADRLRLLAATATNLSPILVFFQRDRAETDNQSDAIDAAWAWTDHREPDASGTDADGVGHRLWVLADAALIEPLRAYFANRPLFIADGHHRYETALNYLEDRRQQSGGDLPPEDPARFVMMHLIADDDPGLVILPLHRLVSGLAADAASGLVERLRGVLQVEERAIERSEQFEAVLEALHRRGAEGQSIVLVPSRGELAFVLSRSAGALPLAAIPADRHQSWQSLDVVLVDSVVVRPLVEAHQLHAEDAIVYTRDASEALSQVRSGAADLAVLVNPTRVEQVAAVALAGERMPEKSTYFYPKAPTGLVFRPLE